MRGADPLMMEVKHELRDWIEPQLLQLADKDDQGTVETTDPSELVKTINAKLTAADLTCTDPRSGKDRCQVGEFNFDGTGYLTGISITKSGMSVGKNYGVLVLETSLGIVCGFDQSASVYQWEESRWQRLIDDEQEIVPGKAYEPQILTAVYNSPQDEKTHAMSVLVLGQGTWCSSNWNVTYHRIWQAEADVRAAKLLINRKNYSFFGNEPPILGSINSTDALIEFRVGSLDGGVHSYETVRHYKLGDNAAVRVDPIALSPRSFVEEWLKSEWKEVAPWSDPPSSPELQNWHRKLHADFLLGDFLDSRRCRTPDTWQVGAKFDESDRKINKNQPYVGTVYFLIDWKPPYRFRIVGLDTASSTDCAEADPSADEDRTLFPIQEWGGWK